MKRLVYLSLVLVLILPTKTSAKKANIFWYFLAKTEKTVLDDGNLSVIYNIDNYYDEVNGIPTCPYMTISLTNKTNENIYVDLSKSKLFRNGLMNAFSRNGGETLTSSTTQVIKGVKYGGGRYEVESEVDFTAKTLVLSPKGTITLDNIILFTNEAKSSFNNMYHFTHSLNKKYSWCCTYKRDEVQVGSFVNYEESNSPITIGADFVYSFYKDGSDSETLSARYFAHVLVGTKHSAIVGLLNSPEYRIISEVYPDWDKSSDLRIKIWCYK